MKVENLYSCIWGMINGSFLCAATIYLFYKIPIAVITVELLGKSFFCSRLHADEVYGSLITEIAAILSLKSGVGLQRNNIVRVAINIIITGELQEYQY